eukprot:865718-Alexandrium_andersonii.AAC.1
MKGAFASAASLLADSRWLSLESMWQGPASSQAETVIHIEEIVRSARPVGLSGPVGELSSRLRASC